MESKLNGQTDSHSEHSAHLWVVQTFRYKVFNILLLLMISDFDLHIFQFKIDIVIFRISTF